MSSTGLLAASILLGLMAAGFFAGGIYTAVPLSGSSSGLQYAVIVNRFTGTPTVCGNYFCKAAETR
jgi:hypothetical protein